MSKHILPLVRWVMRVGAQIHSVRQTPAAAAARAVTPSGRAFACLCRDSGGNMSAKLSDEFARRFVQNSRPPICSRSWLGMRAAAVDAITWSTTSLASKPPGHRLRMEGTPLVGSGCHPFITRLSRLALHTSQSARDIATYGRC